jgi:DNA-binding NarL/FixJ family response regulator
MRRYEDGATALATGRPPPPRVLLADDHAMFRMGLRRLLVKAGMEVVGEASDGQEALRLALLLRPDIVLLDVSMPRVDGLEAARRIRGVCPRTRIVMMSGDDSSERIADCRRAGAAGFVAKGASGAEVLEVVLAAIDEAADEGQREAREMSLVASPARVEETGDLSRLTARELEILTLVAQGHSSVNVAAILGISVRTAETHRQNIMEKLGVHSAVCLTRIAVRMGLA